MVTLSDCRSVLEPPLTPNDFGMLEFFGFYSKDCCSLSLSIKFDEGIDMFVDLLVVASSNKFFVIQSMVQDTF